jgi:fructose-bisphosphate aldolase class I
MNTAALIRTAQTLMATGKGLLAMDESTPTCNRRFAEAGIPQTATMRLAYRRLLVTTPGLDSGISGAILDDETVRQTLTGDRSDGCDTFPTHLDASGIIPGIKVDLGTADLTMFPREKVTQGLDGLEVRAREYVALGARFAKWRAKFSIGSSLPKRGCIEANAHALARYAAICQQEGLVPIVEPEVLMDGDHSLARCEMVTEAVLHAVFQQLTGQRVLLEAVILKPNMVLPGTDGIEQVTNEQVAEATWRCLRRAVPAAVPGVAFLSGGQPDVLATQRLTSICDPGRSRPPWPTTFSFARAIQRPALEAWGGKRENIAAAQHALAHRVRCNSAAQRGTYSSDMEANEEAGARIATTSTDAPREHARDSAPAVRSPQ